MKLRHARVRKKISGSNIKPRLIVFRSNKHIYGQLIDDVSGRTIVSASDLKLSSKKEDETKSEKIDSAVKVGHQLAKAASTKKIKKIVFDKSAYKYHGRIKALADEARKGGLIF